MPGYGSSSPQDPRGFFFPAVGSPEVDLLAYRDRIINPWSIFRNQYIGQAGLGIAFFLGHQWTELDTALAFDGIRGAFIREIAEDSQTPVRPVDNMIDPGVEAEVIALVKRQWTPKIVATSNTPQMKAAAQVAHDRLNYLLEQLQWREKRHRLGLYYALTGTGLMYTAGEKSYMNLKPIGSPSAVRCSNPACDTRLYSKEVPVDLLKQGIEDGFGGFRPTSHLETALPIPPDEDHIDVEEAELNYCPTCPDRRSLIPYEPDEDEARDGVDVFGRALGVDVPVVAPSIEIDLPHEFYPQNGGAMCSPDTIKRWGRRKVREMEWVEERYPHLIDQVDPEPAANLLYGDPVFGTAGVFEQWSPMFDAGILDHHVNVDEVVEEPSFRSPEGRYLVCIKDRVFEDSDLLESEVVEGKTLTVPRVRMSGSRFKLRPGVYWGTSLVHHEIPKQRRINGLDAQVITTRLQMGSPNLMFPADMWPDAGPTQDDGWGVGKLLFLNPSVSNPSFAKPEIIGSVTFPADGWMPERGTIETSMQRSMGLSPASQGQAPGHGVGTTSGIQLLIEQDERSRSLREDELVNSVELGWSHLLRIEWVKRSSDVDTYRTKGPNDTWKYEQYRGQMLNGQVETKIERSPFIGRSVLQREAAREALADKVVEIDGPVTRRKLREMYGLDVNLNEEESNQVDHAERVFVDFKDKSLIHVADPIDDPIIHYEVLGAHARTDEVERMAVDCNWGDILLAIAGWEQELQAMADQEQSSIAFYGGRLVGKEAEEAYTKVMVAYDTAMETYEEQKTINEQQAQASIVPDSLTGLKPPPPAIVPPTPPVRPTPPVIFPAHLQERIWSLWQGMITKANEQLTEEQLAEGDAPIELDETTDLYPRYRVLLAYYKIKVSDLTMGAPMPAPTPGSGATALAVDKGAPPTPAPTAPLPGGGKN